jgi:predicted histidine transporter YuiF (NhaC family)
MEDEYVGKKKKKHPIEDFLPLIGLLLALAMGFIAWVAREPVHDLLKDNITDFPKDTEVGYVIAGVLFLIIMLLFGIIYAIFAPKPDKRASEAEMKKEKTFRRKEEIAKRERKKRVRKQMHEARAEKRKDKK